jgi:hypothetical protein
VWVSGGESEKGIGKNCNMKNFIVCAHYWGDEIQENGMDCVCRTHEKG